MLGTAGAGARPRALLVALLAATVVAGVSLPATGARSARLAFDFQGERSSAPEVVDVRGRALPTATQRHAAARLDAVVRWNSFGTPHTVVARGKYLATGLAADAETAARTWVRDNRALFGLSRAEVRALELVTKTRLGRGHAVLFRQVFGGVAAGIDGLLAVAVRRGRVVYASSSIASETRVTNRLDLSAADAFARAARAAGRPVTVSDVSLGARSSAWTVVRAAGLSGPERLRVAAVPTARGARLAYAVVVTDADATGTAASMSFVEAETGAVLVRQDLVDFVADDPDDLRASTAVNTLVALAVALVCPEHQDKVD